MASQPDTAFIHSNPVKGLTTSVCPFCSHVIAATDSAQLEMAERLHFCAEKWLEEPASEEFPR